MTTNKYKLKLNGGFPLRTGWLQKGINIIAEKQDAFNKEIAPFEFGLGTTMCSVLKYYLKSANIIEDIKKGMCQLTNDFGKIIFEEDRYCVLPFTIYLIHIQLVSNEKNCLVYNRFFNSNVNNVDKDYLTDYIIDELERENEKVDKNSLSSDVQTMLRSYIKKESGDPEKDMFNSPLSSLGLLNYENGLYKKTIPSYDMLDFRIVYYSILCVYREEIKNKNTFKFNMDDLIEKPNNPLFIFNLPLTSLIMHFDEMDKYGYVDFVKTAGLFVITVKKFLTLEELYGDYKKSKGIPRNKQQLPQQILKVETERSLFDD